MRLINSLFFFSLQCIILNSYSKWVHMSVFYYEAWCFNTFLHCCKSEFFSTGCSNTAAAVLHHRLCTLHTPSRCELMIYFQWKQSWWVLDRWKEESICIWWVLFCFCWVWMKLMKMLNIQGVLWFWKINKKICLWLNETYLTLSKKTHCSDPFHIAVRQWE